MQIDMMDKNNTASLIQKNSPDGGFLQSDEWRKFQESVGKKTHQIISDDFHANIIEHELPVVGKYFYIPRGPIIKSKEVGSRKEKENYFLSELISLAKTEKAGWIRIEPASKNFLKIIKNKKYKIIKAPHDMQPKEIFMIDIARSEEDLLKEMKSKTRYNIKLAKKKGVSLRIINSYEGTDKDINEFLRLTKIMAERQKIKTHPEEYYRKMFKIIPRSILKLYLAEYEEEIIAANIVIFYGKTCTYLHGASDDKYKNLMAPYLLQWQAIKDANVTGYEKYDFGGVKTGNDQNSWQGITKFKLGFSPKARPVEFPGSYDIVINPAKYWLYRIMQKIKR